MCPACRGRTDRHSTLKDCSSRFRGIRFPAYRMDEVAGLRSKILEVDSMAKHLPRRKLGAVVLFAVSFASVGVLRADAPPLIPREVLFGNPEKVSPQISPDGRRLAWIAPDRKNVLQVWVKTLGKEDDKA